MSKKEEKPADGGAVKKSPPMMMIIIAIVLITAIGTFVVAKKVSAKNHGKVHKKVVEKGPVLPLDEFLVNLSDPSGDHFLKVTLGVELSKEKGKTPEGMKESVAPIRDAVLYCLNSKRRDQLSSNKGRDELKSEIVKKVNDTLGEDDVASVYFTNFVTQ